MLRFSTCTTLQRLFGAMVAVGVLAAPVTPIIAAPTTQDAPSSEL